MNAYVLVLCLMEYLGDLAQSKNHCENLFPVFNKLIKAIVFGAGGGDSDEAEKDVFGFCWHKA